MISKKPIILELISNPECGKTHFCTTITKSAMIDLTIRFESDVIFAKNRTEQEFEELYCQADSFNSIIRFIRDLPEDITTICFDGSSNLMHLIESQWCDDNKRKQALQVEYGHLYEMLNKQIITPIIKRPSNIVLTSGLRDEYIGTIDEKGRATSVKTGKKERQGIKPIEYIRDIGLNLYFNEEGHRANKIIKNRFVSRTILKNPDDKNSEQIDNQFYIKELKPEANWTTLIDAICVSGSAMRREWII